METPFATNELSIPDPSESPRSFRRPFYAVHPSNDQYEIQVLMPGVAKDHVNVSLEGRNLQIHGSRDDRPGDGWRPILNELNWDDYRLHLELNVPVEEDAISANVDDGVLRLTLPKSEDSKPRRIEIV